MSQAPCGNLDELQGLLNDDLPPEQAAAIVAHVQGCEPCQRLLERLVTRPIDVPLAVATPAGDETTCQEPQPDPAATSPMAGSLTDCPSSGVTADLSPAAAAPPLTDPEATDPEARDPDRTLIRSGPDSPPTKESNGTHGGAYRPTIPGYELLEKLGEGGMGVVYLARQTGLNRLVAVKMIRSGQQARPEHFARFRLEAEAVAQLRHPHIIQIYEIGSVDDLPFVSLELLEGGSLADRLDGTPQPGRQAALLLITLAGAIQAAHDAGIVHRDLKPPNVLFSAEGLPKITDFGLAKRMESDSRQTETGQIMGSPSYMAPEQASGHTRDVGPAADIYALGAILYEMLTGRPPFKGETPIETVCQVVADEVVLPSRLVPRIAADLETICLKCLDKDPSRRYLSAAALAEDLERYHNGETILARRTPVLERAIKWARRRPAAAAALCLGLVVFFSLPPSWTIHQERQSRRAFARLQEGGRLIDAASNAKTQPELSAAQVALSNFRGGLSGEANWRIEGLPARIDSSLKDVDRRLRDQAQREFDQRTELEKQRSDLAEKQRFRTFVGLRTQAQLSAAELELGTGDRSTALNSAHAGLAVYAKDPQAADERWEFATPLPEVLTDTEKRQVGDACYDLLLLLSRAVEPSHGLKILDRAAALRPGSTGALHVRRADCLARAGNIPGQQKELALARQSPPVTALDHLLIGRELAAYRQWREAIRTLQTALRLEPDQASAKLLLAIC